jgi:hypothetical protein
MKKSNFIYLFVLLAGMACLDACKKKEDPAPTRKELLASASGKKWKLTAATLAGADLISRGDECRRDDLFVFYTDKKMVVEEGVISCRPPTVVQGTWNLSMDEKTLTMSGMGDYNNDYTIVEMSSTTLKATCPYAGSSTPANLTFTAQ